MSFKTTTHRVSLSHLPCRLVDQAPVIGTGDYRRPLERKWRNILPSSDSWYWAVADIVLAGALGAYIPLSQRSPLSDAAGIQSSGRDQQCSGTEQDTGNLSSRLNSVLNISEVSRLLRARVLPGSCVLRTAHAAAIEIEDLDDRLTGY